MSFSTDADGFLSQECPSCEHRFKVLFGEGSDAPISYCPYCGHKGQECWHTPEQVEYIQAVAAAELLGPELKSLERSLKGASQGFLKIEMKSNIQEPPPPPLETDDDLYIARFQCCNETVKLTPSGRYFCVICGREIDMAINDSKKVFLSHKGVDKAIVNDFKQTLSLLGYDPWIDEDAMPAGTSLERGLLKGMNDSCGVVFFITSSFVDEGYLQTEVEYAIKEKRKKGEKFAIIALQFVDEEGNSGEIPELLTTYVWKKPKTSLEALREIIRALPVMCGHVDWRAEITGVVTAPKIKSTTTELSNEAKLILTTAVSGDGSVIHTRTSGGDNIYAGRTSMVPDQMGRTVALWLGGLEDLQRRRFIKDLGHKGEVFEVTREGYEAADHLKPS